MPNCQVLKESLYKKEVSCINKVEKRKTFNSVQGKAGIN